MGDNPGYTADFIKSDTDRATFMADPALDHMMTALVSISTELWVQARRMKITERLLEDHGKVTREMIESYQPSAEEEAAGGRNATVSSSAPSVRSRWAHPAKGNR